MGKNGGERMGKKKEWGKEERMGSDQVNLLLLNK